MPDDQDTPVVPGADDTSRQGSNRTLQHAFSGIAREFQRHATATAPIPQEARAQCLYGLAQIAVAGRLLLRHRTLARAALVPAMSFAVLCAIFAAIQLNDTEPLHAAQRFYGLLVSAAPISPVLFTHSYAKLAARAQTYAGLPARQPFLRGYVQASWETLVQLFVIGAGLAPLVAILSLTGDASGPLIVVTYAIWALHWIFIEALDSSRTLQHGVRPMTEPAGEMPLAPWYQSSCDPSLPRALRIVFTPVRWWGAMLARLTRRWRPEVRVVETHPWLAVGFSAGAALVLAIPGVNLFFRPVVVVAAALLWAHLGNDSEPAPPTTGNA
ncbi:MAG: hypothetical protein V3V08_02415 [Nannocystaceae bacterium]